MGFFSFMGPYNHNIQYWELHERQHALKSGNGKLQFTVLLGEGLISLVLIVPLSMSLAAHSFLMPFLAH